LWLSIFNVRIGFIDDKGEPNVIPTGYYFDRVSNKIYITTHKASKKVNILRKKNIIAYCIDDPAPPFKGVPAPPFKGVRGKGIVKIHEDVSHNITIAKKFIMKSVGSLEGTRMA